MSIEISFPFRFADGGVAVDRTFNEAISSHLKQLFGTNPGERVMRPDYGASMVEFVFEPDSSLTLQQLHASMTEALNRFEPDLEITSLEPVSNIDNDGVIGFTVTYQGRGSNEVLGVNTAFISATGVVKETKL